MDTFTMQDVLVETLPLGLHLIVEMHGCSRIDDEKYVESEMVLAAVKSGATVLRSDIHNFGERYGVTGVVLLEVLRHITMSKST